MSRSISGLPASVLDLILSFTNVFPAFLSLWRCGDRHLRSKIASGLTSAHLARSYNKLSPIPSALFELRNLHSLLISSNLQLLKNPTHWTTVVQSLPQTLETLSLKCPDSWMAFFNFAPEWTAGCPKYIETKFERGLSYLISIEEVFPRLSTLHLFVHGPGRSQTLEPIGAKFLCGLPSSLTSFGLSVDLVLPSNELSSLPPSLTCLKAALQVDVPDAAITQDMLDWPSSSSLEHIDSIVVNAGVMDNMSWLPRNLKDCTFTRHTLNATFARTLPPQICNIVVHILDQGSFLDVGLEWTQQLPVGIKSLIFSRSCLLSANMSALPRTLVEVSSLGFSSDFQQKRGEMMKQGEEIPIAWPPSLTCASLLMLDQRLDLTALPKTLRQLHFTEAPKEDGKPALIDVKAFPPNLESLSISSASHPLCQYRNGTFPSTLNSFTLKAARGDEEQRGGLDRQSFNTLPDSLTFLNVPMDVSIVENSACPPHLPLHLTGLALDLWRVEWTSDLPQTITQLRLEKLMSSQPGLKVDDTTLFMRELPSRLKCLQIGLWESRGGPEPKSTEKTFADDCFAHLLDLRIISVSFGRFSSFVLRYLPKGLTFLNVWLLELQAENLSFLPSSIIVLLLGAMEFLKSAAVAQYWPLTVALPNDCEGQEIFAKRRLEAGLA